MKALTYTLLVNGYNIRQYFHTSALPSNGDIVVVAKIDTAEPERFRVSHVEHIWNADTEAPPEFLVHAELTKES